MKFFFKILPWCSALLIVFSVFPLLLSLSHFKGSHFLQTYQIYLPQALSNTIWLLIFVLFFTFLLGVSSAWLCSQYEFPGRKWFSYLLFLPLAFPGYVMAFIYIGLLDESSELFSFINLYFPQFSFRNFWGLVFVMTLCFFSYVYLMLKSGFETKGASLFEVAQSLGHGKIKSFFTVLLPAHWPWLFSSLLLVSIETIADFGTVAVFNYSSLTYLIYQSWFSFFSWIEAAQISSFLLLFVFVLLLLQSQWRSQKRFYTHDSFQNHKLVPLTGFKKWLASLFIFTLVFLSVLVPLFQLLYWASQTEKSNWIDILPELTHSLFFGLVSGLIVIVFCFFLAFSKKYFFKKNDFPFTLSLMGYAFPGTILAVSLLSLFQVLDIFFPLAFLGLLPLFIGYFIRFLRVGFHPIEGAFERFSPLWRDICHSVGMKPRNIFSNLYWPLFRQSFMVSFVLVFIEVIKEMPLTLMSRPFGWDTLSVKVFEWTSEGEWVQASVPSLFLVCLALGAALALGRHDQSRKT